MWSGPRERAGAPDRPLLDTAPAARPSGGAISSSQTRFGPERDGFPALGFGL